jgi:hypothetical protein
VVRVVVSSSVGGGKGREEGSVKKFAGFVSENNDDACPRYHIDTTPLQDYGRRKGHVALYRKQPGAHREP